MCIRLTCLLYKTVFYRFACTWMFELQQENMKHSLELLQQTWNHSREKKWGEVMMKIQHSCHGPEGEVMQWPAKE